MIFFFGERIKSERLELGEQYCPVCAQDKPFVRIREKNYFTLIEIRVLPLAEVADYQICQYCENAFAIGGLNEYSMPSQVELVHATVAYVLTGYGMQAHAELGQDVAKKVTGFELSSEALASHIRTFAAGRGDLLEMIKQQSFALNLRGKQQIIEAAFLVTQACCEIEYEDRLRLNLIASAMDISIAFVNATIEHVRQQGCYGVRRLLPTKV